VRPCYARHPNPIATAGECRLCLLYSIDPRYRALWGETSPVIAAKATYTVRHCKARNVWDWSVTASGMTLASGTEASEEAATEEAKASVEFFAQIGTEKEHDFIAEPSTPTRRDAMAFGHHGDHGDIVYALRSVKQLCDESGCRVPFGLYPRKGTRVTMSKQHADLLLPLLRIQSYISSAEWSVHAHGVRLDAARRFAYRNTEAGKNISEQYRNWLQLPPVDESTPWLRVDRVERVAPVIFNRTPRYRPPSFPWQRIAEANKGRAVFIGSPAEYQAFRAEVSPDIPYHKTADFLEAARVIAGCDLFVGNQSCPRAIAEGLKVAVVVEESHTVPDTHFKRPGAWYGSNASFWVPMLQFPQVARSRASYKDYDARDEQVDSPPTS